MSELPELLNNLLESNMYSLRNGIKHGEESERRRYSPLLRTLRREFQQALLDPESKIKSSLQVAILAILAMYEGDEDNAYATAIKRDRTASRDDHDMTTRCTSLKDAA